MRAADDRYLYLSSWSNQPRVPTRLIAYDRESGEDKVIIEREDRADIGVDQLPDGAVAKLYRSKGSEREIVVEYWLYKGNAIVKTGDEPPWPQRAGPGYRRMPPNLPPKPETLTRRFVPDTHGEVELWHRTPKAKAAAPDKPPANTTPEDLGWKVIRYEVETFPMRIRRLKELPDGRLFGSAWRYGGTFLFDPNSGQWTHIADGTNHYTTPLYHKGKVYTAGYSGGALWAYDPSRPWTVGSARPDKPAPPTRDPESNPRFLTSLGYWARTSKPTCAAVGVDGKLYFGGHCVRGVSGGGLSWWDPQTEQGGGSHQPYTAYKMDSLVATEDGKRLVISTRAVKDTERNKPEPDQGKLFVYDVANGEIVQELEPIKGAKNTGPLLEVRPGLFLAATADPTNPKEATVIYGLNLKTGKVLFRKQVPGAFFSVEEHSGLNYYGRHEYRKGPDGWIWTYFGNVLVRIDPSDVRVEVVGKIDPPGVIAFAGDDIYLGGTEHLRRVRGLVKR